MNDSTDARKGTPPPPPRLPLILLGLLSLVTFVGPFVIFGVVRGGQRIGWPPDRPVEWWTLGAVSTMAVVLMIACLTSGARVRQRHGKVR